MAVRGVFATAERAFGLLTEGRSVWWPLAVAPAELESVPFGAVRWQVGEADVLVELTATTPVTTRVRIEQTGGEPVDWDAVLAVFASAAADPSIHEVFGRLLNNETWVRIGDRASLSGDDAEAAIRAAQAQSYHWYQVGGPVQRQRAEWLLAHVYTVAGVAERAAHHADRCWSLTERHELQDFDRAYALLARSRAAALNGDSTAAESLRAKAFAVPIADPADADAFRADAG
jgi:hypothetical protein